MTRILHGSVSIEPIYNEMQMGQIHLRNIYLRETIRITAIFIFILFYLHLYIQHLLFYFNMTVLFDQHVILEL